MTKTQENQAYKNLGNILTNALNKTIEKENKMIFSENDIQDDIHIFQLLTLRVGLISECKGFQISKKSCYTIIKKRWKLKGNKLSVLKQFEWALKENGLIAKTNKLNDHAGDIC